MKQHPVVYPEWTPQALDDKTDMWTLGDKLIWVIHNKSDDHLEDSVEILAANRLTDIPVVVGYLDGLSRKDATLSVTVWCRSLRMWNSRERQVEKWRI